ncbi:hypothetical protein NST11_18980 [Caldifermentibacillus hisashii]|uniref:hypothetical protein n=1 Tax=Caldifermentibacillus hisashii TaxID=996558 RepID=UPI0031B74120
MKIVNLTPHSLNILVDGKDIVIPPSGTVARAATVRKQIGSITIDGVDIPINKTVLGDIDGLPAPADDTIYVVSMLVAQAVPDRDDVFIVDDAVRDDQGRIIGAKALAHV